MYKQQYSILNTLQNMFSGIVEEAAKVTAIKRDGGNVHLTLSCSFVDELKIDQSVSHNGVCLTVVSLPGDGTYTVRPRGKGGKPQSRSAAPAGRSPAGRQPSPGARFAPHSAPGHKPKSNQQKENTSWKTSKKKK